MIDDGRRRFLTAAGSAVALAAGARAYAVEQHAKPAKEDEKEVGGYRAIHHPVAAQDLKWLRLPLRESASGLW